LIGLSPSLGLSLNEITQIVLKELGWIWVSSITAVMLLTGGVSIYKTHKERFFLLVLPICFALLAAGLHTYPFENRLILFLLPTVLLFLAEGVVWVWRTTRKRSLVIGIVVMVSFFFHPLSTAWNSYPRTHEEARPVLKYLKQQKHPGDVVYVYYASEGVYAYYARRLGFAHEDFVQGIESRQDWRKYIQDLQQLRGQNRVWFFFSHAYNEEAFFLSYLDAVGTRLDELKDVRASVYLYDLSYTEQIKR
jgi:hypothetical protein